MVKRRKTDWDKEWHFQHRVLPLAKKTPWVLRVTEYKDKPVPVFVVKERFTPEDNLKQNGNSSNKKILKERGLLYGQPLRRCLPVIRTMMGSVCDDAGIPLELQQFLSSERITFRGNLPLDREVGPKLALIFKLQERMKDMDRVELIAWRVERFSPEEAAYWLSRATQYGSSINRWAQAGMRIMLGGQPGDKTVLRLLESMRK